MSTLLFSRFSQKVKVLLEIFGAILYTEGALTDIRYPQAEAIEPPTKIRTKISTIGRQVQAVGNRSLAL